MIKTYSNKIFIFYYDPLKADKFDMTCEFIKIQIQLVIKGDGRVV